MPHCLVSQQQFAFGLSISFTFYRLKKCTLNRQQTGIRIRTCLNVQRNQFHRLGDILFWRSCIFVFWTLEMIPKVKQHWRTLKMKAINDFSSLPLPPFLLKQSPITLIHLHYLISVHFQDEVSLLDGGCPILFLSITQRFGAVSWLTVCEQINNNYQIAASDAGITQNKQSCLPLPI